MRLCQHFTDSIKYHWGWEEKDYLEADYIFQDVSNLMTSIRISPSS